MALKEIKSYWFTGRTENATVGIVITDNGYEKKAYIKNVAGISEKQDIQDVMDYGTKLPIQFLKEMIELLEK